VKVLALGLAALAIGVALGLAAGATAIPPGPASIKVTLHLEKTTGANGRITRVFKVFNRPAYQGPIGDAVMVCIPARASLAACRLYTSLRRGQITFDGLVSSFGFYRLAVTGGTGYYDTVGGSAVFGRINNSSVWSVVIDLQGF